MFELESMTKVKVLDVRTLARKDRKPDEQAGAQLLLQAILPTGVLAMFDGRLSDMLYRKAKTDKQAKLEGLEGEELTEIGSHIPRMPWSYEQTGCSIEIDRGMGGKRNLVLDDCKVHRVSFAPQQGGGVKTQWTVDAPALSDDVRGKLTGLKATDAQMTIAGPEVQQEDLDTDGAGKPVKAWPFPGSGKGAKSQDAGEAFAAAHTRN